MGAVTCWDIARETLILSAAEGGRRSEKEDEREREIERWGRKEGKEREGGGRQAEEEGKEKGERNDNDKE